MNSRSGNAIVVILIAVFLFGALAAVFMRGARTGQGNLTANQAKLAAQEIATYLSAVDKAINKLRSRGCSENDISFLVPGFTNPPGYDYITANGSPTAPVDKSCHIFEANGGGLAEIPDIEKYQVPTSQLSASTWHVGNILYKFAIIASGVGTASADLGIHINFVRPEICTAYNKFINSGVSETTAEDANSTYGDVNTTLVGKITYCHYKAPNIQNSGPHSQLVYIWAPR